MKWQVNKMIKSRCGIICDTQKCKEAFGVDCKGCVNIEKPFWGDSCPVKSCCESKSYYHCGQCPKFPCSLLNEFAYDKEQGDDGKRIEVCRIWSDYPDINVFEINIDDVIKTLEKEKSIIIATCADNRVTIRTMSHINDGLTVYFQTGKDYLKCRQIGINPFVAITAGGYDMEGKATLLNHPLDKENEFFIKLFEAKHFEYKNVWSKKPEEIVVKVEISLVKQWRYIDKKPYLAIGKY